MVLPNIAATTV